MLARSNCGTPQTDRRKNAMAELLRALHPHLTP